jgi:tetratricopeptide (TPR) repeat protein
LFELGDFTGAVAQSAEAVRLGTNNLRALTYQARALSRLGKFEEAEQCFRQVLATDADRLDVWYLLGLDQLRRGLYDDAASSFAEILRLQPASVETHFQRALALAGKGDAAGSIAEYKEVLRATPNSVAALNNLAWILATCLDAPIRNGAEAVSLAEGACERTAYREPMFIGTLAAAYAEAGQFDKAVAASGKAISLASSQGQTNLLKKNLEMIELFKKQEPYRENRQGN